ncbi:hypothetical protein Taro_057018 [Colocasia esculenta]|uniref:Sodium/calcium exchanger membrane region domain-containing protein n=1 Tax=Colocasia esculenta TaxID=4460 RepID=A0A843XUX6_COLES|nr:hypothetical protein [Colocasia esculenta]
MSVLGSSLLFCPSAQRCGVFALAKCRPQRGRRPPPTTPTPPSSCLHALLFLLRHPHENATSPFPCAGLLHAQMTRQPKISSFEATVTHHRPSSSPIDGVVRGGRAAILDEGGGCEERQGHGEVSHGYIDYLRLFYCYCGGAPLVGYALLGLWLLVLFYLLGNTASEYFCPSLEGLSALLRLSPAVAGATLLSLGNGAPDVFASIVSFTAGGGRDRAGEVGLSSVLGGAFFVSSVVVGVICVSIGRGGDASPPVAITCFVRDVGFLVVALGSLLAILVAGRITIWGAISFVSLYAVYVFVVSATHFFRCVYGDLDVPLLEAMEAGEATITAPKEDLASMLDTEASGSRLCCRGWWVYLITMPLYLPRRLTIPVVAEERWSKPFAVASVAIAPVLLAALWAWDEMGSTERLELYLSGGLLGIVLGVTALVTIESARPPKRMLLPWLVGGFLMSVVWAYITARELVALLVSLGYIIGVSPSILGLTVLAWGNSIGDLMANVAMAVKGGQQGAQVAISGCYAGPTFNTLVGLGVSLLWSSWAAHPSPFWIPTEPSLYQTLGFLVAGLLWALVILPRRGMKLDRVLGIGLLSIYLCFLLLRISESLGWLQFDVS